MKTPREIGVGSMSLFWVPGTGVVGLRDDAGKFVSLKIRDLPSLCAELMRLFAAAVQRSPK